MFHRIHRFAPILGLALLGLAAPACDVEPPEKVANAADAKQSDKSDAKSDAEQGAKSDGDAKPVPASPTTVDAAIKGYANCHSECHLEKEGTNLSTCTLNCGVAAKAAYHTIEPKPDKAAYEASIDELRTCVSTCDEDTSRETNMHTCYLNCRNSAQVDYKNN